MIDLEKNGKIATGVKSKNIYKPNQTVDFKISRSKLTDILSDLNKREWKDKKDKEYAIGLVSRAVI